jgi:hypothetical protein
MLLNFIAPGDDWMSGRAASYQVRYASGPISPAGFDSASALSGVPAPSPAGTREQLRLPVPGRARYIAVRATDAAGNISAEVSVPIG